MKNNSNHKQISTLEGELSTLEETAAQIKSRLDFLELENRSLTFQITKGEPKAEARRAEIENEQAGLKEEQAANNSALAAKRFELSEKRAALKEQEKRAIQVEQAKFALERSNLELEIIEHALSIQALDTRRNGTSLEERVALTKRVQNAGALPFEYEKPPYSNEKAKTLLQERIKDIQEFLSANE